LIPRREVRLVEEAIRAEGSVDAEDVYGLFFGPVLADVNVESQVQGQGPDSSPIIQVYPVCRAPDGVSELPRR
jgi:hypothetical protein